MKDIIVKKDVESRKGKWVTGTKCKNINWWINLIELYKNNIGIRILKIIRYNLRRN